MRRVLGVETSQRIHRGQPGREAEEWPEAVPCVRGALLGHDPPRDAEHLAALDSFLLDCFLGVEGLVLDLGFHVAAR